MDDRPSLADLHADLLLLPFPQLVSHILMELRADMREVSIMRLGIYRLCRGNSQVGCQKGEEGVKMRHSRMLFSLRISIRVGGVVCKLIHVL